MQFFERLKLARTKAGYSQKLLASKLFISQQAYAKYEIGTTSPNPETLKRISELLDVSTDYLLGATDDPSASPSVVTASNIFPLKTKKVPLLGDIACGEPIFANEEYGSFISTTDDLDVDFCLRAVGDSMIGARIYDGDIVFVRKQSSVDNGEIAAVLIDDEATLKRVYYYPDKNKLVLSPENPKYEPFVYIGEELSEVRILGKAVAFQSVIR